MKLKTKIYGILAIFFSIISIFLANINNDNTLINTNAELNLSNSKVEWGIKRNENHNQPDLGAKNKNLIEQYDGFAMGNEDKKNIYITFDLGYEAGYTSHILDVLKENNVKATFFITAHYLNSATDLVERMINEGHIIGNQFPTMVMYHI